MNEKSKNEMLKLIEITRESIKNNIDISLETYAEVFSKLDIMTFLILEDKKTFQKPE